MGISVGEVEATLRLKDQMSPAFAEASAKMNKSLGDMQIQLSTTKQGINDLTKSIQSYGAETAKKAGLDEQLGAAKVQAIQLEAQMRAVNKTIADHATNANEAKKATDGLEESQRKAREAAEAHLATIQKLGTALTTTGSAMKSTGTILTAAITAPIVAAATASESFAQSFQTNMTRVQTLAGASAREVASMKQTVLDLAPATGIGPDELAKSLFVVESAMYRGAQATDIMHRSADMAALGMGDAETVTRALVGVMLSYKEQNLSAAEASDILVKTVQLGNMKIDELVPALARVNPLAAAMGVNFQDVAAAIATFTHMGAGAQVAATGMRAILSNILNDSAKTEKGFRELAGAVGDSSITMENFKKEIKDRGLTEALIDLMQKAMAAGDKGVESLNKIFPNVRALTEVLAIAKANGDNYVEITEKIRDANGTLAESTKTLHDTTEFKWNAMIAQAKVLAIEVGDNLLPIVSKFWDYIRTDVIPKLQEFVKWFSDLPEPVRKAAFEFAAFMAIVGPAIYVLGTLATALGGIATAYYNIEKAIIAAKAAGGAAGGLGGAAGAGGAGLAVGGLTMLGAPAMLQGEINVSPEEQARIFARYNYGGVTGPNMPSSYPNLSNMMPGGPTAVSGAPGVNATGGIVWGPNVNTLPSSGFGSGAGGAPQEALTAEEEKRWQAELFKMQNEYAAIYGTNSKNFIGPSPWATNVYASPMQNIHDMPSMLHPNFDMSGMGYATTGLGNLTYGNGRTFSVNPYADVRNVVTNLPNTVVGSLMGGGGMKGAGMAAASSLGSSFLKDAFTNSSTGMLNGMSGLLGQTLGAAVPVIGSLIGPAIQGIMKLFGKNEANAPRDQFTTSMGGLNTMNNEVLQATGSLDLIKNLNDAKNLDQLKTAIGDITSAITNYKQALAAATTQEEALATRLSGIHSESPALQAALQAAFDAKNPADYSAALQNINNMLDAQDAKQKQINDTLTKYGIKWQDAGDAFKQAHMDDQAQQLITDFNTLKDAGVGVNQEMAGMGPSLSAFVQQSKSAGTEVPESMRAIIQAAIDTGNLFDENGTKITDMKDLGLKFGTTMQDTMKNVGDQIAHLADVLENTLGGAFKNVATTANTQLRSIPTDLTVNITGKYTGDWTLPSDVIQEAEGGSGRTTGPTLFYSGGNEDFAFSGEGSSFGGGGGNNSDVVDEISALRDQLYQQNRSMPQMIYVAIRDAQLQAQVRK